MVTRISKPWGEEILFALTDRYAGKILRVRKGESLSLQYHVRKEESLYLYEGLLQLTVDEEGRLVDKILRPGDTFHLPPGTRHRLAAIEDVVLFEVSTPELNDVVRLADRYGRT